MYIAERIAEVADTGQAHVWSNLFTSKSLALLTGKKRNESVRNVSIKKLKIWKQQINVENVLSNIIYDKEAKNSLFNPLPKM